MHPALATGHSKCGICGKALENGSLKVTKDNIGLFVLFSRVCLAVNSRICAFHVRNVNGWTVPVAGLAPLDPQVRKGQFSEHKHFLRGSRPSPRDRPISDNQDLPYDTLMDSFVSVCNHVETLIRDSVIVPPPRPVTERVSIGVPEFIANHMQRWTGAPSLRDVELLAEECYIPTSTRYPATTRLTCTLIYLYAGCRMIQIADMFGIAQQRVSEFVEESRTLLTRHFVPSWLRPQSITEFNASLSEECRNKYSQYGFIVDGLIVPVQFTVVPNARSLERSDYKQLQAIKLMHFTSITGFSIDVTGPYSPDKTDESYAFFEQLSDSTSNFHQFVFGTASALHRHGGLADRGYKDAQYVLDHLDEKEDDPNLFPLCKHRLFLSLPTALKGPRLPEPDASRSNIITHQRQAVERGNRRLKEPRLFQRVLPAQMPPATIVEWARIAAAMSNRFKMPLTHPEPEGDESDEDD